MLISCEKLEQQLREPELRVLDVRLHTDYAKSHIPGAVPLDIEQWKQLASSQSGLKDGAAWSHEVAKRGIGKDSFVVVYGDNIPEVGRTWWLLKYVGVEQVSILNGGWRMWRTNRNRPVESIEPVIRKSNFRAVFDGQRIEWMGDLAEKMQSDAEITIIDARSSEEFLRGQEKGPSNHLAGTRNLEWSELLKASGEFKSREEIRKLFTSHNISMEQSAITC